MFYYDDLNYFVLVLLSIYSFLLYMSKHSFVTKSEIGCFKAEYLNEKMYIILQTFSAAARDGK